MDRYYDMDKAELMVATSQAVKTLYERVNDAGISSSSTEGRSHHEISHGLDIPLVYATTYLRDVVEIVGNPEVGKKYSVLRPIKNATARRATDAARWALDSLQEEQIQEVYDAAKTALSGDLEAGVTHYANALSSRGGQKMTDEDVAIMQPVLQVMKVLRACSQLQMRYQPTF